MEKNFLKRILDANDPLSIKRFILLIVSAHFIIASFVALYITFYMVFYVPKGKIDINLLNFLKDVLYDDFMIIAGALGLVGVENLGNAMVERAKALGNSIVKTEDKKEPSIKDEPE